ncbi:MAG: S1 family peptidase, partial [Gammaproteobacteria bacterium]
MSRWLPLTYLGFVAAAFAVLIVVSLSLQRSDELPPPSSASRAPPVSEAEPTASVRRPRLKAGPELPASAESDPVLNVRGDGVCPGACTGTAFAIDDAGHWLTARHVVGSCSQVGLLKGSRQAIPVHRVFSHPNADVSLIATRLQAPALALSPESLLQYQDGFHHGYPGGKPGDVHARLLGRVWVRSSRTVEPGVVWAEVSRHASTAASLGGLSGGPVLTPAGTVAGVTIAASPRRGRVITAAPRSLTHVIELAGLEIPTQPKQD